MPKVIETQAHVFFAENIVAAEVYPSFVKVYPAEFGYLMIDGADAHSLVAQLLSAGFIDLSGLAFNPDRLAFIEKRGALWKMYLDGHDTYFPLRDQQMTAADDWIKSLSVERKSKRKATE